MGKREEFIMRPRGVTEMKAIIAAMKWDVEMEHLCASVSKEIPVYEYTPK